MITIEDLLACATLLLLGATAAAAVRSWSHRVTAAARVFAATEAMNNVDDRERDDAAAR